MAPLRSEAGAALPRRLTGRLIEELHALALSTLFFLVSFALVLVIVKLFVAQYAIQFSVLSNAVLGALIAAKVSLVLDRWQWMRSRTWPGSLTVICRTALYGAGVIVIGILEHLARGLRETGSLAGAFGVFARRFNPHRFFAIVLLVSLVFVVYFAMQEISSKMGKDELYALFFRRRTR
jgi:hypothetical protein